MTSFTPFSFGIDPRHASLIASRQQFLEQVAQLVASRVPEAVEIWCYGLNAMRPNKPTSDWDFIAALPAGASCERLELLNGFAGPLSDLRKIGNQTLDVQAMRVNDRTPCANLIRMEGFCFWRQALSLDSINLRTALTTESESCAK